jgi:hypothetical protein
LLFRLYQRTRKVKLIIRPKSYRFRLLTQLQSRYLLKQEGKSATRVLRTIAEQPILIYSPFRKFEKTEQSKYDIIHQTIATDLAIIHSFE